MSLDKFHSQSVLCLASTRTVSLTWITAHETCDLGVPALLQSKLLRHSIEYTLEPKTVPAEGHIMTRVKSKPDWPSTTDGEASLRSPSNRHPKRESLQDSSVNFSVKHSHPTTFPPCLEFDGELELYSGDPTQFALYCEGGGPDEDTLLAPVDHVSIDVKGYYQQPVSEIEMQDYIRRLMDEAAKA